MTEPMTISKEDRDAMQAKMQEQRKLDADSCLKAIQDALTTFECELVPSMQFIGTEVQPGYMVRAK